MTWVAVAVGGANLIGGLFGAKASKDAAQTQADAALQAAKIAAEQRQPWVDAGKIGLDQLAEGIKPGGQFAQKFTMADAQNMPAMKFAEEQGLKAIDNSAAAKSGLLNSNAIQDTVKFAEGNAAQFENQAFNQWLAQQQLLMKPLESMVGMGSNMISSVADTNANAIIAAGGAQAAGQVGAANNLMSGVSNAANSWQQMDMLKSLLAPKPAPSAAGTGSYKMMDQADYSPIPGFGGP